MKNHILSLFAAVLILLVTSCSTKPREVVIDEKYKMDIPGDLISTTALNDDASLQYFNAFKELYVMVIEDVPDEVYETIAELEMEGEYPFNFEGFCMLVCSGDEDVFAAVSDRHKLKETAINGLNARTFGNTRTINGVDVYYKMALVQGKETYYQVITWTLPQRSKKYETVMDDMINSFTEL